MIRQSCPPGESWPWCWSTSTIPAPDPVTALAAFLKEPPIPLHVTSLTLELPDSLRRKIPATACLSIYHRSKSDDKETTLVFGQAKGQDPTAPGRCFEPIKDQTLDYMPGDDLWGTLPLPDKERFYGPASARRVTSLNVYFDHRYCT